MGGIMKVTAGIEGGGTKFNVGLGNEKGEILDKIRIPTAAPEETMAEVIAYLKTKKFDGIGVGVFGPVELDSHSPDYGKILQTPKLAWQGYNLYRALRKNFSCPIIIEHDVNAALLGELKWGAAQGLRDAVYYTIGTGIGAGLWLDGRFYHGQLHAEAGHMLLPPHPNDLGKGGSCPFHGNMCAEGLVSGPAIEKRYGLRAENIPANSPHWPIIAHYIAAVCVNTLLCFAPQRIILGGGVLNTPGLLPLIRESYLQLLAGYGQKPIFTEAETFIVRASLENDPGLMGAFALAF